MKTSTLFLLAFICQHSLVLAATTQFDQFLPTWDRFIQPLLRDACSAEYAAYQGGNRTREGLGSLVTPVVDCILKNFPEFRKAELASSAVVLGAIPILLQSMGHTAAEHALLSFRRPILSLLLSVGSPAVRPSREADFALVVADFVEQGSVHPAHPVPRLLWRQIPSAVRPWVSPIQYLATLGAIANVVHMAQGMSLYSIIVFAPETTFMPALWTFVSVVIHCVSALALRLRVAPVQRKDTLAGGEGEDRWRPDVFRWEVVPSAQQPATKLVWRTGSCEVVSQALSWFVGVGIAIHVFFGTLVFSSLLFFSLADTITILGRFCASAIVCRAIVRFEVGGIKESAAATGFPSDQDDLSYTSGAARVTEDEHQLAPMRRSSEAK